MNIKLTTLAQVDMLRAGDILKRFPSNSDDVPQDKFDELRTANIDTYEIRSINPGNKMFSLITSELSKRVFMSPVDVGRLFIKSDDLIREKIWWVNS